MLPALPIRSSHEGPSRAWRTDLSLLQHSGSVVEHHPAYAVVHTPQNPGFRWGNFLLLRSAPGPDEVAHWTKVFVSAFPGITHRAFGVDDPAGTRADLQGFAGTGFSIDASTVMTAGEVRLPPRPNTDAEVRRLASDDDWAPRVELALACKALGDLRICGHSRGQTNCVFPPL